MEEFFKTTGAIVLGLLAVRAVDALFGHLFEFSPH